MYEIQDLKEIYFKLQTLQTIDEQENKAMKKHKVKIPKGYTLVNETKTVIDGFMTITLGLEPIPMERSIKKELPKTWEELLPEIQISYVVSSDGMMWKFNKGGDCENMIGFPTEELARADAAFRKLIQLRDYYNGGWVPDWTDNSKLKYCIYICDDDACSSSFMCERHVLAFKSAEIEEKFRINFRNLIETAKPLL